MAVFSDMPFDILLEILNWLPFHVLLRFMAVSRHCRDASVAHRYYWHFLELNTTRFSGNALEGAIRLYFLRLDRAGHRPVVIRLYGPDLRDLLRRVLPHFAHVHTLALCGVDPVYSQEVIDMLSTPAPQLQVLVLKSGASDTTPLPLIGEELFESSAPNLRTLLLQNVRISTPAPVALSNIATLYFVIHRGPVQQLPYLRTSGLSKVQVFGNVSFAPEYFRSRVWRHVRRLDLVCPGAPPASHFPWHACRRVPQLSTVNASLQSCLAVLKHICGPLGLSADISLCKRTASFEFIPLPEAGVIPTPIWRSIAGVVPTSPADPNIPRDSAVYLAIVAHAKRIVKLDLPLAVWDHIIPHVSSLPALTDLRLLLAVGDDPASCSAVLEAPKLQRLVFGARYGRPLPQPVVATELKPFLDGPGSLLRAPKERRVGCDKNVSIMFPVRGGPRPSPTRAGRMPR